MGDYDAATEYYDEFVEIAPHDDMKYVLRYAIKKGQGASFDELITILEEYKDEEYTEEWAYELAYLYHKAGKADKCIDACGSETDHMWSVRWSLRCFISHLPRLRRKSTDDSRQRRKSRLR